MKKLFILAGILAMVANGSTAVASDGKKTVPQPRGGCLRVLFSCCCTAPTVDVAVGIVTIVHRGLEAILASSTPAVIREVYLLCENAAYALSDIAVSTLTEQGFLDGRGNLKEGWREHIKLLLIPDGSSSSPEAFYFEQRIEDLMDQHPEAILKLIEAALNRNAALVTDIAPLLNKKYQLSKFSESISLEEIDAIVTAIHKEQERQQAAATKPASTAISRAHTYKQAAPQVRFRLRAIA